MFMSSPFLSTAFHVFCVFFFLLFFLSLGFLTRWRKEKVGHRGSYDPVFRVQIRFKGTRSYNKNFSTKSIVMKTYMDRKAESFVWHLLSFPLLSRRSKHYLTFPYSTLPGQNLTLGSTATGPGQYIATSPNPAAAAAYQAAAGIPAAAYATQHPGIMSPFTTGEWKTKTNQ